MINIKQEHPQDAVFATNNANNTNSVPSYSSTNQFNQFFADNTATDQTNNLRANTTTATNATNSNDSNQGFMANSDEFTMDTTAAGGIVPETTHKGKQSQNFYSVWRLTDSSPDFCCKTFLDCC